MPQKPGSKRGTTMIARACFSPFRSAAKFGSPRKLRTTPAASSFFCCSLFAAAVPASGPARPISASIASAKLIPQRLVIALLPTRTRCPSELDALLGLHPVAERVLHHGHLGHQVSQLDQLRLGVAARGDDMQGG